jgi:hypothetical protein
MPGEKGGTICQEVMEKAHPGGAALEQGEAQEWEEPGEEEWVAQEQAQGRMENALVLNAARLYLTKPESLVILSNAPNAGKRW